MVADRARDDAVPRAHARWTALPIVWPLIGRTIAWTLVLPLDAVFSALHATTPPGPSAPRIWTATASRAFPLIATSSRSPRTCSASLRRRRGTVAAATPAHATPLVVLAGADRVTPAARHAEPMPASWAGRCELRDARKRRAHAAALSARRARRRWSGGGPRERLTGGGTKPRENPVRFSRPGRLVRTAFLAESIPRHPAP